VSYTLVGLEGCHFLQKTSFGDRDRKVQNLTGLSAFSGEIVKKRRGEGRWTLSAAFATCRASRFVAQKRDGGERLDNDPSGARYGCFLPDLTRLARRLPAPTSHPVM